MPVCVCLSFAATLFKSPKFQTPEASNTLMHAPVPRKASIPVVRLSGCPVVLTLACVCTPLASYKCLSGHIVILEAWPKLYVAMKERAIHYCHGCGSCTRRRLSVSIRLPSIYMLSVVNYQVTCRTSFSYNVLDDMSMGNLGTYAPVIALVVSVSSKLSL